MGLFSVFDDIGNAFKSVVGGATGLLGGAVSGISGIFGGGGSHVPAIVRPPPPPKPIINGGGWTPNPLPRPRPLPPSFNVFPQPIPDPKYGGNVDRPAISVNNQVVSQPAWQQYVPYIVVGGVVVYLLIRM